MPLSASCEADNLFYTMALAFKKVRATLLHLYFTMILQVFESHAINVNTAAADE